MKKLVIVAAAVAVIASPAFAQKASKRDAAMGMCIQQAQQAFTSYDQVQRTAVYKACMKKAGFKP